VRWIQILRPKFLLPKPNLLRPDLAQPLPLWMIFPVIFAALYASHFLLLRLPYFWDEAGYYIPAAWDFYRSHSLIPTSTLTNAHPPLPSVYLALWWWADGFLPEVTREAVLIIASFGLLGVWRLVLRLHGNSQVALWTVALTALYPIWFTQSTLAHADIFAAAFTIWGLVYSLPDRDRSPWLAALWFSLAALSKETAIIIPLTLIALNLFSAIRATAQQRARLLSESLWLAASALPLAVWYAYHRAKTGYFFGNPEFLRYNAQANLEPLRIMAAFAHRLLHLTAHMNLFVPVLCAIGALFFAPFTDAEGNERTFLSTRTLRRIAALAFVNALFFSILGGALLTRYLLPIYPLIILVAVSIFFNRVRYWQALTVFAAAAFLLALFINPPYGIAPEDNLSYARFIRLHQHAIDYLKSHNDGATVLTAWPATDELTRPELGYVKEPFDVYRLEDFTASQISHAAADSAQYSAAFVFSTKFDPPPLSFLPHNQQMESRYFGLHHDLTPDEIAKALGGEITWKEDNHGLWAAIIRFNHPVEAQTFNLTILNAKLDLP
jgi:4-amino-4-deoxy-L-arabinose transferase-like glycosyltransferase